jgi:hypothetical protein
MRYVAGRVCVPGGGHPSNVTYFVCGMWQDAYAYRAVGIPVMQLILYAVFGRTCTRTGRWASP